MATIVGRLQPRDLAAIGLQDTDFLIGTRIARPIASGATGHVLSRFPLPDTLLQNGGGQEITRLNTFLFEFSKGQRRAIFMQAPTNNFMNFGDDIPQAFPLFG